jgi:hypothetical protein
MARSSKESWLQGPGDVQEAEVKDVPVKGESVLVRGLPAAYSNRAQSEALELITGRRGEQSATVNTAKLEVIQFAAGCVEPKFSEKEAEVVATKYGPAFKKVIAEIDRLSGLTDAKKEIEQNQARFPNGSGSADGEETSLSADGGK